MGFVHRTIAAVRLPIPKAIVWAGLALLVGAAVLFATGGFTSTVLGFRVTARSPGRALALSAVLLVVGYVVAGRRAIDDEIERVIHRCGRAAAPMAGIAAVLVAGAALRWGTFAASGVDAYGYVSQAALWERGALSVDQPFVADVRWPGADAAFAPLGYRPAVRGHAIVPSYPPGLPLMMAAVEAVGGRCGPYYVVPILGAILVWCCYLLGCRAATPGAGACAAVLLACSPAFLVHVLAPMSDIPAAAFWTAALLLSLENHHEGRGDSTLTERNCSSGPSRWKNDCSRLLLGPGRRTRSAVLAGVCAAAAILVRPNLAPLAVVIAVFQAWPARRQTQPEWSTAAWFGAAVGPGLLAIAILDWRLYGSPLRSGYDDLGAAYAIGHVAANVQRYTNWLLETQTAFIALSIVALLGPILTRADLLARRTSSLFLAFLLTLAGSYFAYAVFDDWRYLRFMLPALPLLLVAMSASGLWAIGFLPVAARVLAFIALATFLVSHEVRFAVRAGIGRLATVERRYVAVARFLEASTPSNAVCLALQHAGSIRHYAGRLTVRFDQISVGLNDALASLERAGWRPFIVLEDWEEPQFKRQFAASSEAGRLAWRPYARLDAPGGVNVYDPRQMHETVHDLIEIPPPDGCDCRHY